MKRDRHSVNLRHAEMLALIRERQEVMVEELSDIFGVSSMTVRRDLAVLEEQGKINRFHGGASADLRLSPTESKHDMELCRHLIAMKAASLVKGGDTLLINGSSTALSLLRFLEGKDVNVYTNNARAVMTQFPSCVNLQLFGGTLKGAPHILTGDLTLRNLMDVHGTKAFLGCTGISLDGEIMCGIPAELGINETMIAHADEYYILADFTKIGKSSTYASFHLEKRGCVITDEHAPAETVERLRAIGMQVLQVGHSEFPDVWQTSDNEE